METPYKIRGKTIKVGDVVQYDGRKYKIEFKEYEDSEGYTHQNHYGIVAKGIIYLDGSCYIDDMPLPDFVYHINYNDLKNK